MRPCVEFYAIRSLRRAAARSILRQRRSYEAEHYVVSMQMAERRLLPAVRAAGDPALRAACLDALARLGDETAFNFLLDLLANAPPHDAHAARRALAVYRDDLRRWRKVERAAARRTDLV